jgi:6-phosphofructokinase 1
MNGKKKMSIKRVAVLTSGGDAPGMNACIRAITRTAIENGLDVYGVKRGYDGLVNGEFVKLTRAYIVNILQRGGTVLETSRSPYFKQKRFRIKAIKNLEKLNIDALIVLGGDGTFRGADALIKDGFENVVGVPCSIDNDIYGTDFTIGFDTALNTALEAIDRIRDTATSHERIFFVEVMGRNTGYIALNVGIAGGAEQIIIPERTFTIKDLCNSIKRGIRSGKRSFIIVIAEGEKPGKTFEIAKYVDKVVGLESRVCILGHVQRGGSPTARDRILATKLGVASVDAVLKNEFGKVVGEIGGKIVLTPFKDTWSKKKPLDSLLLRILSEFAY